MSNDNYLPLLDCNGGYYTAASAGAFNERAVTLGSFAAFCAFVINGEYQTFTVDEDSPPAEQWLWGNFDVAAGKTGRGWSLTLRPSAGGQGQILARVAGADGTIHEAAVDITGAGLPSPIDRVIVAGLWYLGFDPSANEPSVICLSLNGAIVAAVRDDTTAAAGYLASPYAARLGADPVAAAILSPTVEFISCGYAPVSIFDGGGGAIGRIGEFAASSWRGFYSGYANQSFVSQDGGLDWLHRYSMRSLAPGLASDVVKTPQGAYVDFSPGTGYAPAPASIPDVGNQTTIPTLQVTTPAVALARTGAPKLLGAKNIPYYAAPSLTFPVAPP